MSLLSKRFYRPLQEFLASSSDFRIVHSTSGGLLSASTERLCILDSSFNPPHLGHYALARESLKYHYKDRPAGEEKALVLLLSVKNADKSAAVPASFEDRIYMMYLMSEYLAKELHINVSVGLTTHAKFVDKLVSILNYLKNAPGVTADRLLKLTFLVGYDTLVRIFDPKYYLPDKLSDSLNNFMKATDLFCLTRKDNLTTYQEQAHYMDDIRSGKHAHIPSHWSLGVHIHSREELEHPNDEIGSISSSAIRKGALLGDSGWKNAVIPDIAAYIAQENIYKH